MLELYRVICVILELFTRATTYSPIIYLRTSDRYLTGGFTTREKSSDIKSFLHRDTEMINKSRIQVRLTQPLEILSHGYFMIIFYKNILKTEKKCPVSCSLLNLDKKNT